MGLEGQYYSKFFTRDLEGVLKRGIETKNPEIISFLKKHLYPIYERYYDEAIQKKRLILKENYK